MERYGIVYKITNRINNKVYIGISKKSFNHRYSAKGVGIERVLNYYVANGKRKSYVNVHLVSAIMKYGFDAFEIQEEIDVAYSEKELLEKEKFWIAFYDSTNYNLGYNRTLGGEHACVAGEKHPRFNSVIFKCDVCGTEKLRIPSRLKRSKYSYCSKECKAKGNSLYFSGENNPTNKKEEVICDYCKETIRKPPCLINNLNYCDRNCQKEHYKEKYKGENNPNFGKGTKVAGKRNGRARKVICLTTNEIFDCMLDGANKYGIKNYYIVANCTGRQKSAGKLPDGTPLRWQYYEEYLNKEA